MDSTRRRLSSQESKAAAFSCENQQGRGLQSVSLRGLFPCGEGAGYAGGIVSAAVDGMKCAEAVLKNLEVNYEN